MTFPLTRERIRRPRDGEPTPNFWIDELPTLRLRPGERERFEREARAQLQVGAPLRPLRWDRRPDEDRR